MSAQVASKDLQASDTVLVSAAAAGDEVVPRPSSAAATASEEGIALGDVVSVTILSLTVSLALLVPLAMLGLSRVSSGCTKCALRVDTFSTSHPFGNRRNLVRQTTVLGGACTGSMWVVLAGLAASALVQHFTANTLVSTRFDPAGGSVEDGDVLGTWSMDLAVVVDGVSTVADCPAAASALSFSGGGSGGVARMGWGGTSGPSTESTAGSSNFVCHYRAECTDCALQSTLRAGMSLPAGAQSVAWALTVNRAVTPDTVGQRVRSVLRGNQGATDAQRLRSGTWTLTATRETLQDVRNGESATGYLLAFVDQHAAFLDSSAPVSGFVPQLNPVSLQVAVTLSPSASTVTVSELQSLLGLLGALGGIVGAVMGLWQFVFTRSEVRIGKFLTQAGLLAPGEAWEDNSDAQAGDEAASGQKHIHKVAPAREVDAAPQQGSADYAVPGGEPALIPIDDSIADNTTEGESAPDHGQAE